MPISKDSTEAADSSEMNRDCDLFFRNVPFPLTSKA